MKNSTNEIKVKSNIFINIKNTPKVILIFFGGLLVFKISYDLSQGVQIFGDKNNAFFDVWSFEHIITGMSLSYFFCCLKDHFIGQ